MIQFCTCIKRFYIEIPEGQDSSNSCPSCGRILSIDELGGLSRRMWSTMEPELSRVIDPQLKWKISSNGKQRALRRARNFTRDNGKKSAKDLKDIEGLFDKASKREGDMLISESEKFGVSLLGRRFGDSLATFPIKKRIISLLPSQPAPHILSSSGVCDHDQTIYNQVSHKHYEHGVDPSHGVDLDNVIGSADDHTCDSADFSGISILAAAACHSSIDKGLTYTGRSTVKGNSFQGNPNSSNPELGNNESNPSAVDFTTVNALVEEPGPLESDECKVEHSCSLHSLLIKRKQASSDDDRLHWDLNTVMDVWEGQSDDYSKCCPSSDAKSTQRNYMVFGNQGPRQDGAGFGINGVGLVASDMCKSEELGRKHESLVADCDKEKCSLSQSQVSESLQGKYQFKDTGVMEEIIPERTIPEGNCENSFPVEGVANFTSHLSAKMVVLREEGKCENNFVKFSMNMNTYNSLPCPAINRHAGCNMHTLDTFSEDKKAKEVLHVEGRSITAVNSCNDNSAEFSPACGGTEKNNQLGSPHVDKHRSLSTDVALSLTKSPAELQPDENTCRKIIDGEDEKTFQSSSNSKTVEGLLVDADEFGHNSGNDNQATTILFKSQETSGKLLPSINACISPYEDTSADTKVDDSKSSILSCENLNASKSASPFHTNQGLVNSFSEGVIVDTKGIPPLLFSHGESLISAGHVKNLETDSEEKHLDYEHHVTGLEKVDLLGDDDSQYEDGELREYVLNSWEEDGDGDDEVETERVDYGSDCREADSFEAESDFCSQSDLAAGTTEYKDKGRLISTCDGNELWFTEDSESKCLPTHSSRKDDSNVDYSEGAIRIDMLKDSVKVVDVNVVSEVPARDDNRFLASNLPTDASDVSGKASQLSSSRMKSSGWDAGKSHWKGDDAYGASAINDESAWRRDKLCEAQWFGEASYVRENMKHDHIYLNVERSADAASLDGRSRSFRSHGRGRGCGEEKCRWKNEDAYVASAINDKSAWRNKPCDAQWFGEVSYDRENMKHDHIDLNAEMSADAARLDGRSRSFHSHGRERSCVEENCGIGTSGYYLSPKFPHSGSRNAAEAAVAKVESNGFVVAPDGTIVKGYSLGPGSHLSGHSSKSSSAHFQSARRGSPMESDGEFRTASELSNSREISPGRCFIAGRGRANRHGSRLFSLGGHNNKYHAPIIDNRIGFQQLQHPSSRHQRSVSPHKRSILLSHELTRLRSKTRSPHAWISPRVRNDVRINGVPDVKRPSGSPTNFKTQRRFRRQRSPQHRGGVPAEDFVGSSPSHASRFFDNDRVLRDNFQEHRPRCPRGRSPPARIFSKSSRLDDMDPHGRMKPDEYYEPIYSGRFQAYASCGRGTDHDGLGAGRRGKSNRYGMFHPEGRLKGNNNMNCLYGDEFRSDGVRTEPLAFQRRQSPRAFDRNIDAQNGDSPRRIKGEMVHFTRGRGAKWDPKFKSFKFRNTCDDM